MGTGRNLLLYPFSLIYRVITDLRNFFYNSGILTSHEFHIPIICVGNITVGGTGKTPHTEYLVNLLKENFKVAVLSRGYKRKSRGLQIASDDSSVKDIGDEPLQIFRKFRDVLVTVDRNRIHGVDTILIENPEIDVIILDDGFQHRSIKPGLSILLSDFNRPIVKDHLMPYGNLRESIKNIRRADVILITKSPDKISPINKRLIKKEIKKAAFQELYFTSFTYKDPLPVFTENPSKKFTLPDLNPEKTGTLLVTGVACPEPFKAYLDQYFREIIHLAYPDHHCFTKRDIEKISAAFNLLRSPSKFVITTEKDAVRLGEFTNIAKPLKLASYYIPVEVNFPDKDKNKFDKLISDYVRKNKRNNNVFEGQRDG